MNHGSNLTLLEMDAKNRSRQAAARAMKARRRQIVGPQSGEDTSVRRNNIVQFASKHTFELAASMLTIVVIGGGITSAVMLV